ncbi:MAG TPA: hypothetical protein VGB54_02365 [Allosphingosinicella sp.]|jgi:endonuclease YncB( thermonuclease family)
MSMRTLLCLLVLVTTNSCTAAPAQSAAVQDGDTFTCTPIRVWDGDGPIWCAEGPRIRLAGIAARETDGSCRPGHPCPAADAATARDHLARLIGRVTGTAREGHLLVEGPPLICRSEGSAGGSRTAAWCRTAGGVDLSCRMVADSMAARWERFWRDHRC